MDLFTGLIEIISDFRARHKIEHVERHFKSLSCRHLENRILCSECTGSIIVLEIASECARADFIADLYRRTVFYSLLAYHDLISVLRESAVDKLYIHPLKSRGRISSYINERLIRIGGLFEIRILQIFGNGDFRYFIHFLEFL